MPMTIPKKPKLKKGWASVQVRRETWAKLRVLAKQSGRSIGGVIAYLASQATAEP